MNSKQKLFLLVGTIGFSACTSNGGGVGAACDDNGECMSNLVCSAGVCSMPADAGDVTSDVAPSDASGDIASDAPQMWADGSTATYNGCGAMDFVDRTRATASHTIDFGGDAGFAYSPRCIWVADGTMVTFQGDFTLHPLAPGDAPSRAGMDAPGTTPNPIPMTTSGSFVTVNFPAGVEGVYTFYCGNHESAGMFGAILVL